MSIIVEYFTAPDDTAAAKVLEPGPDGVFETVEFGNFDALTAMAQWDAILTGRDIADIGEETPRVIAGGENGSACYVFAASSALRAALAAADQPALAEAAVRWTEQQDSASDEYDPEVFTEILCEIADLVREVGPEMGLYCWMC